MLASYVLKVNKVYLQFSLGQSLSRVRLFATPWIASCQASLSSSAVPFTSCPQSLPASDAIIFLQLKSNLLNTMVFTLYNIIFIFFLLIHKKIKNVSYTGNSMNSGVRIPMSVICHYVFHTFPKLSKPQFIICVV